jgi:hypothetical protein
VSIGEPEGQNISSTGITVLFLKNLSENPLPIVRCPINLNLTRKPTNEIIQDL